MAECDDAIAAIRGCRLPSLEQWAGATAVERFKAAIALELERRGWRVFREVAVSVRGRERRIDLVAELGAAVVAIELDAARPRALSVDKLLAYERATSRVLGLRVGHWLRSVRQVPKGIDAIAAVDPPRAMVRERKPPASSPRPSELEREPAAPKWLGDEGDEE